MALGAKATSLLHKISSSSFGTPEASPDLGVLLELEQWESRKAIDREIQYYDAQGETFAVGVSRATELYQSRGELARTSC